MKKATEIKPNWADAHYQLAMLYSQKNDMKSATKELEITLENLDPKINQKEYDAVKQTLDKMKKSTTGAATAMKLINMCVSVIPAPDRSRG